MLYNSYSLKKIIIINKKRTLFYFDYQLFLCQAWHRQCVLHFACHHANKTILTDLSLTAASQHVMKPVHDKQSHLSRHSLNFIDL